MEMVGGCAGGMVVQGSREGRRRRKKEEASRCVCVQSCPTLCNTVDCSLPGSSVHAIFQARILEWGVISLSQRKAEELPKKKKKKKKSQSNGFLMLFFFKV